MVEWKIEEMMMEWMNNGFKEWIIVGMKDWRKEFVCLHFWKLTAVCLPESFSRSINSFFQWFRGYQGLFREQLLEDWWPHCQNEPENMR